MFSLQREMNALAISLVPAYGCFIKKNGLEVKRLIFTAYNVGVDSDGEVFNLVPDNYSAPNVSAPKPFVDSLVRIASLLAALELEMNILQRLLDEGHAVSGSIKALCYTPILDDEDEEVLSTEEDIEVEDEEDLEDLIEYYVPEFCLCLNSAGQAFYINTEADIDAEGGLSNAPEVYIPAWWVSKGEEVAELTSKYVDAKKTLMESDEFREAFAIRAARLAR